MLDNANATAAVIPSQCVDAQELQQIGKEENAADSGDAVNVLLASASRHLNDQITVGNSRSITTPISSSALTVHQV